MILYRNYDLKIIRELLMEIGPHRYEQALKNMQMQNQKPLGMKGWYLEANQYYLKLCYMYPSRYILMLMDVDKYDNIPSQGWERIKVEQ